MVDFCKSGHICNIIDNTKGWIVIVRIMLDLHNYIIISVAESGFQVSDWSLVLQDDVAMCTVDVHYIEQNKTSY